MQQRKMDWAASDESSETPQGLENHMGEKSLCRRLGELCIFSFRHNRSPQTPRVFVTYEYIFIYRPSEYALTR